MSQETDALLRTILFQAITAKNHKFLLHAIKAMCSKDLIAAVEKEVALAEKEEEQD
jgi:hypothetical protein